jgi:hypothetical protein
MIKKITKVILTVLFASGVSAQFNPAAVNNSLVRVVVSSGGGQSNVLTGFVWKNPNQIVTSLHGMSRNGTIKVLYLNQAWREARIKKVLQKADLVLLELIPGQSPVPAGVVPLTSFSDQPIRFGTEIYAMGFNLDASGSSSRTLKRGFVDPETLNSLIPKKDKEQLAALGFPALDLHILYLEGSLLPGYSGAPVFDPQGRLIGIGDGGLERGASNVSWIIPAKYLTELEASTQTTLPANFEKLAQLFSARITIDAPVDDIQSFEAQVRRSDYSKTFKASGFEFYLTKNRSLIEMVETSEDPDNLLMFAGELESFNISIDYEKMRFDIYEDINNGVILAVPEGKDLYYDPAGGYFAVRHAENSLVGLMYYGSLDDYSYTDFQSLTGEVQDWVNTYIALLYGVSGFETDEDYSYWLEYPGGRKISWISMMSNDPVWAMDGSAYVVGLYITLLMTDEKSLMALSSYLIPVSLLEYTAVYGIDCVNPVFLEQCEYFESMVKVFCAAHLTTFAY